MGGCRLTLPMLDNQRNARGEVLVAPEHRRRGIGRALLAHLRAEATRAGRVRLVVPAEQRLQGAAPDPAGRFAAAFGAVPARVMTRWWLDVDSVDPAVDLARAQLPALRILETYNADSNFSMVRINEAMGFRPHSRVVEWQLEL